MSGNEQAAGDEAGAREVLVEIEGHVAEVRLNRPEKLNALSATMFSDLARIGRELAENDDVRIVILSGMGGAFSSGLDTSLIAAMAGHMDQLKADLKRPVHESGANRFQEPCMIWRRMPKPVIAALEGVAFGGGLQLALGADFRFAAPDTRLSVMEARWGIVPDMGLTQLMAGLVRPDNAKELIMTARVLLAREGEHLGLVTRLADDPRAAAWAFAEELSLRSPEVLAGAKRLVDEGFRLPGAEGLALEAELQSQLIGSPNQIEAVMAQMQKRKPKYR